jgi:hypothetical protein
VVLWLHNVSNHALAWLIWVALTASSTSSTGCLTSPGSVRTRAGTTIRSPPEIVGSGRTSRSSRAVRPHNSGVRPAWCRQAATVEPIAPGPTTAMLTPTQAKLPRCRSSRSVRLQSIQSSPSAEAVRLRCPPGRFEGVTRGRSRRCDRWSEGCSGRASQCTDHRSEP